MQTVHDILILIDSYIGSAPWFPIVLIGTGLFFTIYLKFPQIRYFNFAIKILRGKFDKVTDQGDTTHFQALATALSGTVGTGNISGVALAIHIGGPAALFWMLITAAVGMCTKFVEVLLSHKYREVSDNGTMAGGPMYYMKNRLNMKWLAIIFAICTVLSSFGTGSLPQINSISNSIFATFGVNKILTGGVLTVFLFLIVIGGIKRIAKVSEKLVPFMAVIYFIGAFATILYNYQNVIPSIVSIFDDLFTGSAASGGFLGASVAFAFNRGVSRGLFSNEAGQGSAPIAHAAAKAHEPVSEGLVAILEPFIDTIVICTLTGLTILSSGVWNEKHNNEFQFADIEILTEKYDDQNEEHKKMLYSHLNGGQSLNLYNGNITVENGLIIENVSIINARSLAEDITVFQNDKKFSGEFKVENGKPINSDLKIVGKSLLHSAPLTAVAFNKSLFGDYGQYIVSIGLLLFAFSTAISWSYYGDRAMTFLLGSKSVIYYHIIYIIGFFLASFVDTNIIWTLSGITIALMTLPNLFGILILHKEVKSTIKDYWKMMNEEFPDEKTPE